MSRQAGAATIARMTKPEGAPYSRVKHYLKTELRQGRWPPGALMPSESALVAQFGVSRMTVSRALRELQAEGLVDRVQGVGSFAAQLHRVSSTLTIRDLREEIEARGHRHHVEVALLREEKAPPALAAVDEVGVAVDQAGCDERACEVDFAIDVQGARQCGLGADPAQRATCREQGAAFDPAPAIAAGQRREVRVSPQRRHAKCSSSVAAIHQPAGAAVA